MTEKLKNKIIAKMDTSRDVHNKGDKLYEEKLEWEKKKEIRIVEMLKDKAAKKGTVVLGLDLAIKSAKLGEIEKLYVDEHFKINRNIVENLIDNVEKYGGNVEFLQQEKLLDQYSGVAAELRYI